MTSNPPQQTVAEAIADELVAAGVDRVFGLPGGEVLWIIDALRRRGIEFQLCRHESAAGVMAGVYGKLSGTVGVALTTLGPGAANLMFPLSNSLLDREPLLAISADIPDNWPLSHTHQRLPLHDVYRPLVKASDVANGFTVRAAIRRMVAASRLEPMGPTYLTVSAEEANSPAHTHSAGEGSGRPDTLDIVELGNAAGVATAIRDLLSRSDRPLVLLGLGARAEVAPQIRQWLDAWDIPVAVTPKVKGIVDETADNFVGVVGGMSIDSLMVEALTSADLLIGFGFDPVELDKTWHAELPIHWVLEAPNACGVVPRGNLLAVNHDQVLAELSRLSPPRHWPDPFAIFRARRRELYQSGIDASTPGTIYPTEIVRALAEVFPPETIVTTDVGSHKYLFGQFWPSREPCTFFMSNGLSGMGYGLPAAIGAKLARPDVPVLAVSGDGGFSMYSQELETAKRLGAEIIVVVLADNSYSLIRHSQANRGLPNYGVDFAPIDSVQIAHACGMDAVAIRNADQLATEVGRAVSQHRSLLVEIPVNPDDWKGLV